MYRNGVMYYDTQSQQQPVSTALPKRAKAAIPILPPPEMEGEEEELVDPTQNYAIQQLELQKADGDEGSYEEQNLDPVDAEIPTEVVEVAPLVQETSEVPAEEPVQDKSSPPEIDDKLEEATKELEKVEIAAPQEVENKSDEMKVEKTKFLDAIESEGSLESKKSTEL